MPEHKFEERTCRPLRRLLLCLYSMCTAERHERNNKVNEVSIRVCRYGHQYIGAKKKVKNTLLPSRSVCAKAPRRSAENTCSDGAAGSGLVGSTYLCTWKGGLSSCFSRATYHIRRRCSFVKASPRWGAFSDPEMVCSCRENPDYWRARSCPLTRESPRRLWSETGLGYKTSPPPKSTT